MKQKVIVACHNASGEADMFTCTIECTQDQYEEGDHYELAEYLANEAGYEGPFVCFDESEHRNIARNMPELVCSVPFVIKDGSGLTNYSVDGKVRFEKNSINVSLVGYSDCSSMDNEGTVLSLDCFNGGVSVLAYANINLDEPTDIIDLKLAKNIFRQDDDK